MRSLQTSALIAGASWGGLTILVCAAVLLSYLGQRSEERFRGLVEGRHSQIIVAVANYSNRPAYLTTAISNPVYQRPFSGRYWQVVTPDGTLLTSPSLVDETLPLLDEKEVQKTEAIVVGPSRQNLLHIAQVIVLDDGSRWAVHAASALTALEAETDSIRRGLISASGLVFIIGVVGSFMLVRGMLQPLNRLREDVAARWMQEDGLDEGAYPVEVAPLVSDINTLLRGNRDTLAGARRQAADLAHGMKTPSAIMRNELSELDDKGVNVAQAVASLDRLDAQLHRAFSRMRADGAGAGSASFNDVTMILSGLERAFDALAQNAGKELLCDIAPNLRLRVDSSDLEEVIGNVLDNALKWATKQISLNAWQDGNKAIVIAVKDDGPGTDVATVDGATMAGLPRDTQKSETGLGLSIASDLVRAYGGTLKLGRSEALGGLKVCIRFPLAVAPTRQQTD